MRILESLLLFWELFTPALADGFALELSVTKSLQDSSQYSG